MKVETVRTEISVKNFLFKVPLLSLFSDLFSENETNSEPLYYTKLWAEEIRAVQIKSKEHKINSTLHLELWLLLTEFVGILVKTNLKVLWINCHWHSHCVLKHKNMQMKKKSSYTSAILIRIAFTPNCRYKGCMSIRVRII